MDSLSIEELREEIAQLDRDIMDLVGRRISVAKRIGVWKNENGRPIRDPDVEDVVVQRYVESGDGHGISARTSTEVARALIREAVDVQASLPRKSPSKNILIIGGLGKMGQWLERFLSDDGHNVHILDVDGPDLEVAVLDMDVIIISTPISSVKQILKQLDSLDTDALIFDVSSLKSPFSSLLKDMAQRLSVCSVHPMFGPSVPSLYDRNILFCDCGDTDSVLRAMELFDGHGANMVRTTLDNHDRRMAYVLGMGHAVNVAFMTALADSGMDYGNLKESGSTTFRKMMEGVEEVSQENPHLYYEIQNLNDNARITWSRFMEAVDKVMDASLDGSPHKFVEIMEKGRSYLDHSR